MIRAKIIKRYGGDPVDRTEEAEVGIQECTYSLVHKHSTVMESCRFERNRKPILDCIM